MAVYSQSLCVTRRRRPSTIMMNKEPRQPTQLYLTFNSPWLRTVCSAWELFFRYPFSEPLWNWD